MQGPSQGKHRKFRRQAGVDASPLGASIAALILDTSDVEESGKFARQSICAAVVRAENADTLEALPRRWNRLRVPHWLLYLYEACHRPSPAVRNGLK
eukprot:CAMPEP_0180562502 /NCGR_PEP_ID=MMETSP1037_2-20121125/3953_1 /TAXON_ID=632150 /ORGANISM="Azadinium spinosum, Strain 3D9" /LENGTH=96 /DNA_ID=CAMNT_0022579223 /DNA_START=533 /DNA_END=824 /DNA_ORIENTATION=+